MGKYARGRRAWGICQRSGKRVLLNELVRDGHSPELLVAPEWWEPRHPQEFPPPMDEAIALYRPSPEESLSVPDDFVADPLEPLADRFQCSSELYIEVSEGETRFVLTDPLNWVAGDTIYVYLPGGEWWAGQAATSGENSLVLTTLQAISEEAVQGACLFVTEFGSGVPIMTLAWDQASLEGAFSTGDTSADVSVTVSDGTGPFTYAYEIIGVGSENFTLNVDDPTDIVISVGMIDALGGFYDLELRATVTDSLGDVAIASLPMLIDIAPLELVVSEQA